MKIVYVGAYDKLRNGKQEREYSLAAAKKMDYLCHILTGLGNSVEIVSPAYCNKSGKNKYGQIKEQIEENVVLTLTPTWEANNKISRATRAIYARIWLFTYLLKNCGKKDRVIAYHQYYSAIPVLLARFFKQFHLILEIEEQYSMVWKLTKFQKWRENLFLNAKNKKCVVVSELLKERLNIKDAIISYGSYSYYKGDVRPKGLNEDKLLVYTGSIDKVKGSAFTAIETMKYLPSNYKLEISGPVTERDKKEFESLIYSVNKQYGRNKVVYRGVLNDDQYQELLLNADIALNPQSDGEFGNYLFPSKILTYLSYGLPVVSTKGASIVVSKLANVITFADDFTPASVAKAIKNIKFYSPEYYMNVVRKLDSDTKQAFYQMLNE